jgi:hypothetical protein
MTSTRRAPVAIVWSLMSPVAVMMALQVGTPDPSSATAIEQALIERMCSAIRSGSALGSDVFQECLSAQLRSLRADFGRDLDRLSNAERKAIDAVCSKASATRGREGYVACLSGELASLRERRSREHPTPPPPTLTPSPSAGAAAAIPAPPAPQAPWWSNTIWIGAAVGILCVAAGGVFLAVKSRRVRRKCRVCGTDMSDPGDLCQKCRHEAAEAVRRAAAERADQRRAQEEEPRRHEEEQRRLKARQEEETRAYQQEQARQREKETRHLEEEARKQEEEVRQRRQADMAAAELFDPYEALGVPRDASKEDIRAAYHAAKLKYDPDQVAYLSAELQEHYKTKAQAADRAYQMLTE